jgi:hypothetical protein
MCASLNMPAGASLQMQVLAAQQQSACTTRELTCSWLLPSQAYIMRKGNPVALTTPHRVYGSGRSEMPLHLQSGMLLIMLPSGSSSMSASQGMYLTSKKDSMIIMACTRLCLHTCF